MSERTLEGQAAPSARPSSDETLPFEAPLPSETTVFVVDDDPGVVTGLERFLGRAGYRVHAFTDPEEALRALQKRPPEVLLTDHSMPGMTGLELAQGAQEADPDIAVIVISGVSEIDTVAASLRMRLDDYLTKPLELPALERAISRAVLRRAHELYHRALRQWMQGELDRRSADLRRMSVGALDALMNALEARREHFLDHSQAVARYAESIAKNLGLAAEHVRDIRVAGLLHDVGMIGIPDRIVEKPGALDDEEYALLKSHCSKGARILDPLPHMGRVARYVEEHHERLDGSGYPSRKGGDEISLGGQIVGLAEMYTALLESRPYRDAVDRANAFRTLEAAAGTWFSEPLIRALLEEAGEEEEA